MSPSRPLLLTLLALAACRPEAAEAPVAEAPHPVQVAEVHLAPEAHARSFTGQILARREADVGFRTGGRITARLVDAGSTVQAGQVMARLDAADLTLALRSAQADLEAAAAEARRATAEAQRSRSLRAAGHVAAAYDEQRIATARAAVEQVASASAALDLARNRLGYAELRAPSDGVVIALLAEAGQVVAEGAAILRLADPSEREVLVALPEQLALPPGAAAEVTLWSRPGEPLAARLREAAPQAEGALRTRAARFALDNPPDWAALGATATVRVAEATAAPVATLPRGALHDRGQGAMVWRLAAPGRVEAVPVTVARLGPETVALRGDLAEGDLVVTAGVQLLDAGSAVRIADRRPAATLR
ncbi:RND family efflux transporter MFP subunit [Humitalea rosea]|uniref:RND family efflux transporter MFP subunit n=1 Tax=Humitalea rosea TaxID=990373 RepID=A0A2W7KDY8_9PROT|nr:efflux RND transporter periplasmic adaptor subunit [Humitalea rosea]PZW45910.1 RND family efflux transporter MFP subunit [Humitalea rosea]